jgi:polyhydroxyalkanoate synthesis regulator phasin
MGPAFRDRVDVGRARDHVRGVAAKLVDRRELVLEEARELVDALRRARAAGATLGELAADAGLSRSRVGQIVNGGGDHGGDS